MTALFYGAGVVAVIATVMVITRLDAVHALLYLVVSLLAVALVFESLGAPFAAALEVIIYAGAIMVLFVIVVMVLNIGPRAVARERGWLSPGAWVGPTVLLLTLMAELVWSLASGLAPPQPAPVGPKAVAIALYGPYLIGVELASMLLLAGLVGAYHVGQRAREVRS